MITIRPLLLVGAMVLSACGSQAQDARTPASPRETPDAARDVTKTSPPPKPLSADADAPTGEPKDKEKERRGNTPPGSDRSGGAPAEGAIVDPAGVTRK